MLTNDWRAGPRTGGSWKERRALRGRSNQSPHQNGNPFPRFPITAVAGPVALGMSRHVEATIYSCLCTRTVMEEGRLEDPEWYRSKSLFKIVDSRAHIAKQIRRPPRRVISRDIQLSLCVRSCPHSINLSHIAVFRLQRSRLVEPLFTRLRY